MKPDTKSVFISLLNALQAGKIYSQDHPIFKEFSDALHKKLTERLADGNDSRPDRPVAVARRIVGATAADLGGGLAERH